MPARSFGVDGCRAGWFCVGLADGRLSGSLHPTLSTFLEGTCAADTILIDIPIGLKGGADGPRQCDVLARQLLGPRASSVFSAPIRELLQAGTYLEANALSRQLADKGLSKQTWNICAKIREVDRIMQTCDKARESLHEAHPELCFYGLNRGQPMQHSKRRRAGFDERLALLARHLPDVRRFLDQMLDCHPRSRLAPDDVLDAAACALTASLRGSWRHCPDVREQDRTGLPMAIVFPDLSYEVQTSQTGRARGPAEENGQSAD